jgi:O-antigen/teichoic acid export membrane protein
VFDFQIVAFFISPLVANLLFLLPLIRKSSSFHLNLFDKGIKNHMYRFVKYGSANLFYNLGIFLLISADRFIIEYFEGYDKVGIYHQTYNLAQISMGALFTVFGSALNPSVLAVLETKLSKSNSYLQKVLYSQLYIFIPLTLILCLFSKDIVFILLGEKFREAWKILPVIYIGVFFNGMNYLGNAKLKFMNRLKVLMLFSSLAAVLNIVLNLVLIPEKGYQVAGYTTFASYLLLFVGMFIYSEFEFFKNRTIVIKTSIVLIISLLLLLGIVRLNEMFIHWNVFLRIGTLGLTYLGLYVFLTYKITPFRNNYLNLENESSYIF